MHRRAASIAAMIVGLLLSPVSVGSAWGAWLPYTRVDSFNYSESVPVVDAFDNFKGNSFRSNGDVGFTHTQTEVGVSSERWRVGVLWRYDYRLDYHPDTAELYYRTKNDLALDTDRDYRVRVDASHIRSFGVGIGRRWHGPRFDFELSASFLRANSMVDGDARGNLDVALDESLEGEVFVDYTYTKDQLFNRPQDDVKGYGIALGFEAVWETGPRWRWKVVGRDLISSIFWRDAPFTKALVTSNTASLDEDGVLQTRPVLSGIESNDNHWQRLPVRYELQVRRAIERHWALYSGFRGFDTTIMPSFDVGFSPLFSGEVRIGYGTRSKAVRLQFGRDAWKVALTFDSIFPSEAYTAGIVFSIEPGRRRAGPSQAIMYGPSR